MALQKTSSGNFVQVEEIISQPVQNRIIMGISDSALAHITERLTDLYSDPIAATVREIMSNAHDATVELPEDQRKPIQVTLPNALNPTLIIEDFGVGMSPEIVKEVYSQYGVSTKGNNFNAIGAYGLGAKAPLAYANEYTVQTTRDGITTLFSLSRQSEGNFVKIISEKKTDKPNGTKIMIPVLNKDRDMFIELFEEYGNNSFSAPVVINDKQVESSYVLLTEIPIYEDSETTLYGRVWCDKNFKFSSSRYQPLEKLIYFNLSGWIYANSYNHFRPNYRIIVEIKPGIVDFSSSRDTITENQRKQDLVAKILESQDVIVRSIFELWMKDKTEAQVFNALESTEEKGKYKIRAFQNQSEVIIDSSDLITEHFNLHKRLKGTSQGLIANFNQVYNVYTTGSERNSALVKKLDYGEPENIVSLLFKLSYFNRTTIAIVENAGEKSDKISSVITKFRKFQKDYFESNSKELCVVLLEESLTDSDRNILEDVKKEQDACVLVFDYETLMKEFKEKESKPNKNINKGSMSLDSIVNVRVFSSYSDAINDNKKEFSQMKLQDVINMKTYIILTGESHKFGAKEYFERAVRGLVVEDGPIVEVSFTADSLITVLNENKARFNIARTVPAQKSPRMKDLRILRSFSRTWNPLDYSLATDYQIYSSMKKVKLNPYIINEIKKAYNFLPKEEINNEVILFLEGLDIKDIWSQRFLEKNKYLKAEYAKRFDEKLIAKYETIKKCESDKKPLYMTIFEKYDISKDDVDFLVLSVQKFEKDFFGK